MPEVVDQSEDASVDGLARSWLRLVAAGIVYAVVDLGSRLLAGGAPYDVSTSSLLIAAISRNWVLFTIVAVGGIVGLVALPRTVGVAWIEFEQGRALRAFAMFCAALAVFRLALYDYNWVAGRWHLSDRLILVALAVSIFWRPAMVFPFIVVARVLSSQFAAPLVASPAGSMWELALSPLTVIAACFIVSWLAGRPSLDMVPLLYAAVLASAFWLSGVSKLAIGWLRNDLSALPQNAYLQGWRGHTDGGLASQLSDHADNWNVVLVVGVLVFELGVLVALFDRRVFAAWMVAAPLFHGVVFIAYGFVLIDFVLVELGFLWLVLLRSDAAWLGRVWSPKKAVAAVVCLAIAGLAAIPSIFLFGTLHLAWFDANVVYRYEVVAVTASGDRLIVEPSSFAPYDPQVAWASLGLGPATPRTSSYGVTSSLATYRQLAALESFAQLEQLEQAAGAVEEGSRARAVDFFVRFVRSSAEEDRIDLLTLPVFLTSARGEIYRSGLIDSLEVTQVTSVRFGDEVQVRRELAVVVDATGERFDR